MIWKWVGIVSAILTIMGLIFAARDTIIGYAEDLASIKSKQAEILTSINDHQVSTLKILRQVCRNGAKDRYALDKCEE